ncbi:hypothetical protein pipiens_019316 [Culex pipiens pipiens]|uniref:Uncharacterized protein n=1 Tax=Culex pipiens pipiens TaxID=38569 RepID=A0ABD1DVB1_CULPP
MVEVVDNEVSVLVRLGHKGTSSSSGNGIGSLLGSGGRHGAEQPGAGTGFPPPSRWPWPAWSGSLAISRRRRCQHDSERLLVDQFRRFSRNGGMKNRTLAHDVDPFFGAFESLHQNTMVTTQSGSLRAWTTWFSPMTNTVTMPWLS